MVDAIRSISVPLNRHDDVLLHMTREQAKAVQRALLSLCEVRDHPDRRMLMLTLKGIEVAMKGLDGSCQATVRVGVGLTMTTDPLPAAVRRYLEAVERRNETLSGLYLWKEAGSAMSRALAQHGKVEAVHAAAVALADTFTAAHAMLCKHPQEPVHIREGHAFQYHGKCIPTAPVAAYSAAKAALAESNQEAGGDSFPAGDNAESAGHALRRSDPETGTVPPASPSAAAITAAETLLNSSASEIHSYDRKVFGVVCLGDAREIVRNAVHAAEQAAREGEHERDLADQRALAGLVDRREAEIAQLRAQLAQRPAATA